MNPFMTEEDDHSFETKSANGGYGGDYYSQQIQERQGSSLASTQRSLAVMAETEQMGVETAQELLRQGEQLNNVERNVDKVNTDLKTSRKTLTSIKSVFGGMINFFRREESEAEESSASHPPPEGGGLSGAIGRSQAHSDSQWEGQQQQQHPALRLRDPDAANYDQQGPSGGEAQDVGQFGAQLSMQQYEARINRNIGDLSSGMTRLKGLALGLGDEIEEQNEQLDRLGNKIDKADTSIYSVNKDMTKMLYK